MNIIQLIQGELYELSKSFCFIRIENRTVRAFHNRALQDLHLFSQLRIYLNQFKNLPIITNERFVHYSSTTY